MKPLILLCHPFERSFCHALADAVRRGVESVADSVVFHDLYAEAPDPLLTGAELARRFSLDEQIQRYSDEVVRSDTLFVVHPDWWSAAPALLKGWIERVLRPGIAYDWQGEEFTEKQHVPLLTGRTLGVFVTTDRTADDPPEPIEGFWRDLASYSGMELARYTLYADLRHSGHRQRRAWLRDVTEHAKEMMHG
jgi:putative NADPH-quinone reductase